MDYDALCRQIMAGLKSPRDRLSIYEALAQLPSAEHVPKLLQAWNLLYPKTVLFDELERVLDDQEELQVWERLTGQSAKSSRLSAVTTASYFNLRATPGQHQTNLVIGMLVGAHMPVKIHGKSVQQKQTWYLLEFSATDYAKVISPPKNSSATVRTLVAQHRAWTIDTAVTTCVDYDAFMAQLRAFEMIHRKLSLKQRITLLRQMAHPEGLPFDDVIGTSGGRVYEDTRPQLHEVYQLVKDAKAFRTPTGEIIDIYHFIVGLDVYQEDRMGRMRVKGIRLGESDPSATWAGDIGAGAADAFEHKDKDFEAKNPRMSEEDRILHYYESRAPVPDLLGDLDAWAVTKRVDRDAKGDTISSIIDSVYGRGNATKSGAPKLRKVALENFLLRHELEKNGASLTSKANLDILQFYINDFGRVWLYRARVIKEGIFSRTFWLGSHYDKAALAALSEKMAAIYLQWLENQCTLHGVLSGTASTARK